MLRVTSQYKIAKRLGASVFEKTQSQKFALSDARAKKAKGRGREGSDYNRQLLEKQRVRFTYGLSERQLSKYAGAAIQEKVPGDALNASLELRADNIAYRAGFASTRRASRQMASHGHLLLNGKRITAPSHRLSIGDTLEVREKSRGSAMFAHLTSGEKENLRTPPTWLSLDESLMKVTIEREPSYNPVEVGLDYATVFEFYSR